MKRSGALLGSNSMRNSSVTDDKHEQDLPSVRVDPAFLSCLESCSVPRKTHK